MREKRGWKIAFWGLIFMVTYLYLYEINLTLTTRPTPTAIPEHADEIRHLPGAWIWISSMLERFLTFFSFPTYALGIRLLPPEPYYWDCVYIPFACAFQWFIYGCLFGWWRSVAAASKLHRENQKRTTEN
jgi:hypothetical protein